MIIISIIIINDYNHLEDILKTATSSISPEYDKLVDGKRAMYLIKYFNNKQKIDFIIIFLFNYILIFNPARWVRFFSNMALIIFELYRPVIENHFIVIFRRVYYDGKHFGLPHELKMAILGECKVMIDDIPEKLEN